MQERSKREEGLAKGSITLFYALMLTLILSFLFSLLEAARAESLKRITKQDLLLSLESEFGAYHIPLWEDYRMLFLEGGNGSGELDLKMLEGNMIQESCLEQRGISIYQMVLKDLEICGYALATDWNGAAFKEQACKAIQEQMAVNAAELVKTKLEEGKTLAEKEEELQREWNSAQDAVKEAEKLEKEGKQETDSEKGEEEGEYSEGSFPSNPTEKKENLPENPMDAVKNWKKSSVLDLVVKDPSGISEKGIKEENLLANREKEKGNLEEPKNKKLEKLWFIQYLNHYFSCQTGKGAGGTREHALDYELEYCIGGKETDRENLERTVCELLLLREAGNFVTIMQDGKKQALALEIAAAAVGFTGLAPVIQAVKIGILLAWSYIESILDVRNLLKGGKVPLVKAVTEWKSDVSLGHQAIEKQTEKGEGEKGMDYREYLQILLLMVRENVLVERAMNLVEQNMRLLPGGENFRMDVMLQKTQVKGTYESQPLFLGFVTIVKAKGGTYRFVPDQEFSY
ncbi:MAG: hypothetical protein HFH41_07460 [Lachnospiraceae bacterium]|nr:hypothetical protein [Lachnospiraceae bacterium]